MIKRRIAIAIRVINVFLSGWLVGRGHIGDSWFVVLGATSAWWLIVEYIDHDKREQGEP